MDVYIVDLFLGANKEVVLRVTDHEMFNATSIKAIKALLFGLSDQCRLHAFALNLEFE